MLYLFSAVKTCIADLVGILFLFWLYLIIMTYIYTVFSIQEAEI